MFEIEWLYNTGDHDQFIIYLALFGSTVLINEQFLFCFRIGNTVWGMVSAKCFS